MALAALAFVFGILGLVRGGEPLGVDIPTGQTITPTAANGAIFQELDPKHQAAPEFRAGQAAAVSVAPDGSMLAILTSGYNRSFGRDLKPIPELSKE